jgi:hypothetical protein
MDKQLLLNFIEKYSLGGEIESVAWEASGKKLKTRLISDDKSLLGEVSINNFEEKEFEGRKLAFFKTSEFLKILGVLQDNVNISLQVIGESIASISLVDDKGTKTRFALSDLAVIPVVPNFKHIPSEFEISAKINPELATLFTKAVNALTDVRMFTVHSTAKKTQIILGQTDVNTNNVMFDIETESSAAIDDCSFNADLFKKILNANKGVDTTFKVSKEGLAVIECTSETYTAKYYLVSRSK